MKLILLSILSSKQICLFRFSIQFRLLFLLLLNREVKGEAVEVEPLIDDDSVEPVQTTKLSFDYYFRIDYSIIQSSCRSMSLLNMSAHHDYVKLFVRQTFFGCVYN